MADKINHFFIHFHTDYRVLFSRRSDGTLRVQLWEDQHTLVDETIIEASEVYTFLAQ